MSSTSRPTSSRLARATRYSLTVAAGDLIGATPLLSAAFHDEPTIEAMNALKLDASAVGNHEFDEGYRELPADAERRLHRRRRRREQPELLRPSGSPFQGADFQYLAANVKYAGTNKTILPAYTIKNIKGAKIGFIGMTLKDTPTIVTASGVAGLEFTDEVETANALVPVLKAQGVNAIVVLIHQGGTPGPADLDRARRQAVHGQTRPTTSRVRQGRPARARPPRRSSRSPRTSTRPSTWSSPVTRTSRTSVTSRTRRAQSRLVTSASSFGRLFTDTDLTYDRRTQDIVRVPRSELQHARHP